MPLNKRGGSALARPLLDTIQRGTMAYTYKGIPTLKNPFDWALYPMLLWEARPQTIVEIGSNRGGSALWLADTMRAFGLPAHIHSVDLNPVADLDDPSVTFHRGDADHLERDLSRDFIEGLARPLLVIEDSRHHKDTTLAVLNFFQQWLRPGEYIIVEDGIITELGLSEMFAGGPQAALEIFLSQHPEYDIVSRYCDWFGKNVTYNVNGFLRRLG
ncbi:MAG TPA: CmcI family methyltransferase [Stellaceae bacterium]|nr:CmcI family methyltransferase [Stellaceae bacterium]